MVKVRNKLDGQKFGKLTVIAQAEDYISPSGRHDAQWLCECSCSNKKIVRGSDLKGNRVKSCGRCNTYDLSGDYGICTMANGDKFFFDLNDYDIVKEYCWCIKNGYVQTNICGKKVYLHRMIMNPEEGYVVDHINHLRHDNRRANLRVCTQKQNCLNTSLRSDNSTGHTGISINRGKYRARIVVDGKEIYLGAFDDIDEAIEARRAAEEKYFGEFAYNGC